MNKLPTCPPGVPDGDPVTVQQRTGQQMVKAPAEESHAKDTSVQQRTNEPVVGVEAVQPRLFERAPTAFGEAPLNITLPHRDVRRAQGPRKGSATRARMSTDRERCPTSLRTSARAIAHGRQSTATVNWFAHDAAVDCVGCVRISVPGVDWKICLALPL